MKMTDEKWITVRKAAESRRTMTKFAESKYRLVIDNLPETPDQLDGYHSKCDKNFTAVPSSTLVANQHEAVRTTQLRSAATSPTQSRIGLLPAICLYCDKVCKSLSDGRKEGLGNCQTKEAEQKIRDAAQILNESHVLQKIAGIDLIAKEAKFHHSCRNQRLKAALR